MSIWQIQTFIIPAMIPEAKPFIAHIGIENKVQVLVVGNFYSPTRTGWLVGGSYGEAGLLVKG